MFDSDPQERPHHYVGDLQPGAVDGRGVDGIWFVVTADGEVISADPGA